MSSQKTSKEIAKRPINLEPSQKPISLEDVGLDDPNVRHRTCSEDL
jgi:hypothetical protein